MEWRNFLIAKKEKKLINPLYNASVYGFFKFIHSVHPVCWIYCWCLMVYTICTSCLSVCQSFENAGNWGHVQLHFEVESTSLVLKSKLNVSSTNLFQLRKGFPTFCLQFSVFLFSLSDFVIWWMMCNHYYLISL